MASIRKDPRDESRWLIHYVDTIDSKKIRRTRRLDGCFTKGDALKRKREVETRLAQNPPLPGFVEDEVEAPSAGLVPDSITKWSNQLGSDGERAGKADGQTARRWIVGAPALAHVTLDKFNLDTVFEFNKWLLTIKKLGAGSRRNLFTLLSRWASWAVGERLLSHNPCRDVPAKKRPQVAKGDKTAKPWVQDDETLHRLMACMPHALELALWLGNRSGLRVGELFGLRLSDLADLDTGYIRVTRSWDGPLKESKRGEWKTKWAPSPVDAVAILNPLVAERRSAGALDDDLLFVPIGGGERWRKGWKGWHPNTVGAIWREVRVKTGYKGDLKSATRHSFASRNIMAGIDVAIVSRALGHASVKITEASYDHVIRMRWPDGLRAPALRPPQLTTSEAQSAANPHDTGKTAPVN